MPAYVLVTDAPLDADVAARQQERWCMTLVQLDAIQELARSERVARAGADVTASILRGHDPDDRTLAQIVSLWYDAHDEAAGRVPRSESALFQEPPASALGFFDVELAAGETRRQIATRRSCPFLFAHERSSSVTRVLTLSAAKALSFAEGSSSMRP